MTGKPQSLHYVFLGLSSIASDFEAEADCGNRCICFSCLLVVLARLSEVAIPFLRLARLDLAIFLPAGFVWDRSYHILFVSMLAWFVVLLLLDCSIAMRSFCPVVDMRDIPHNRLARLRADQSNRFRSGNAKWRNTLAKRRQVICDLN